MAISDKLRQQVAGGGWIRKMFEEGIALKQKYGEKNVFDLTLGNPVMEPPQAFRDELRRWVEQPQAGMHRYMPNAGYAETRAAVAGHLSAATGLPFTQNEIVMTCGAAGALNVVLKTILNAGDEVVIFAPYFVEYVYYIDNAGGVPQIVQTDSRFVPYPQALAECITPRTRAVVINSPNNPTGAVYGHDVLRAIGEVLGQKEQEYGCEIFLISDDVYRRLVYDGMDCPYVFQFHPRSIIATSYSKDLALPGERIGYIAVSPHYNGRAELVNGMVFCNRTLGFVNAPALMQNVVRVLQDTSVDIKEYEQKRDFLYGSLKGMGYSMVKPEGAFYIFPRSPIDDDVSFVGELQKHNVLVVPGKGFGAPGYFRLSYCVEDWVLEGSLAGFKKAAEDFGLG